MDYVYEMARTLRQEEGLPITLFLEKGSCDKEDSKWCVVQKFSFAPLRILENIVRLLSMRFSGHTTFYVHYSFVSAISAGLITKVFGGTVYYWNCGQPWMYTRGFLTDQYQKLAYRLIDYLVTGVEAVVPGYMETYGLKLEQVKVISNWIDIDSIEKDSNAKQKLHNKYALDSETKILLFLHTLSSRYGAEFLPEILEGLKDRNVHLLVAGDGNLREFLEKTFIEKGLTEKVTMLGYVARDGVKELLSGADVFLMPSEGAGSPHSLIEAMAYELPFVTFDVGGVRESAPPEAALFIYEYGDTKGLTAGIETLLSDAERYKTIQATERDWITRFSKQAITQKFKQLFLQ